MAPDILATEIGKETAIQTKAIQDHPADSATNVEAGSIVSLPTSKLDDAVLRAQGHEAAMPRSFSVMSALGLGFSFTNS